MPLFEYVCKSCDCLTEELVRYPDAEPEVCPECGGELRRIVSLSSFHLIGGGWFRDTSNSRS
jgi:putative FmdB family regulatory protein